MSGLQNYASVCLVLHALSVFYNASADRLGILVRLGLVLGKSRKSWRILFLFLLPNTVP